MEYQDLPISLLNQFMKRKIPILSLLLLSVCLVTAQTKSRTVPPPPPPSVPLIVETIEAPPPPPPVPRVPPKPILPKEYIYFLKRNPAVLDISWSKNNRVHILLKTGKKEVYNLNNSEEVKKLEVKYGKLPPPPPGPPVED